MKFSIRKKVIVLIVLFALVLSGSGLIISSYAINEIVDSRYKSGADQISLTVSHLLDGDQVLTVRNMVMDIFNSSDDTNIDDMDDAQIEAYLSQFEPVTELLEFDRLRNQMHGVQADVDVDCVYLMYVDPVSERCIYIVDAADEDACYPGWHDPLFEVNRDCLKNPARGFPAYITDTEEYGWLLTSASPVFSSDGEVAAYAAVDVSMNTIRDKQSSYFWLTVIVFLALTIILSFIGFLVASHFIVKPIRLLSNAADKYVKSDAKSKSRVFSDVKIRSHDEIRELSDSMKVVEHDINNYITNLVRTRKMLEKSRERVDELNDMASTDSLTGLKNKRAFEKETERINYEIVEGTAKFGIVMVDLNNLKEINDDFGHDKGDIAIKGIANMICREFVHSPVYRIGGDEFVVIIEHDDYDNINYIVRSFRLKQKELKEDDSIEIWEKMRAALGFAIFDEINDESMNDVFKRADDAMYQNKKKMKEQDRYGEKS